MVDAVRTAILLCATLALASSAAPANNSPPQAIPPGRGQPVGAAPAPAPAPGPQQYSPCEYACGQIFRCQLSAYEPCVAECRNGGTEHDDAGRARLDAIARTDCTQLAAEIRAAPAAAPPAAAPPAATPPAGAPPPGSPASSSAIAGRWLAQPHVSYTNAAMTGADIALDITIAADGSFSGTFTTYACFAQAYGIWSCSKNTTQDAAIGRLDTNGTGWIELSRVGRASLTWRAKSATELFLELPRNWQDGVLFQATIKRP
jgi:hypothetical protein